MRCTRRAYREGAGDAVSPPPGEVGNEIAGQEPTEHTL
ncbi:hypothetical protein C884_00646 [Kocuria palustris PEL]|uniref:Uncharacterized protein n=1 Tax=Kocuria palustris PEL TaxID=1236550 RepID=M2WCF7_9MICC|nr:hypothetical protein C884_00646 [Kocuria palustris PEL]